MDLLLTLEEFCGEEGVFEGAGERGAAFAAVFPKVWWCPSRACPASLFLA